MTDERRPLVKVGDWLLCEACQYSWLHDPTRPVPTKCPECGAGV